MTEKNKKTHPTIESVSILTSEPAALGLTGLAVAAFVLGAADLGFTSSLYKSLMIPWVCFFGATAQLIAGIMEFKRNNVFGSTVFTGYAMTMYTIALTVLIVVFYDIPFDLSHYGFGLIAILVFSLIATAASLMVNTVFFSILIAVDLAVISLIFHYLNGTSAVPGGIFLFITSILSFYAAAAILLNTMAGKTILSLGKAHWKP